MKCPKDNKVRDKNADWTFGNNINYNIKWTSPIYKQKETSCKYHQKQS
jgi:hypothetical protein